jgi:hypothetical protein
MMVNIFLVIATFDTLTAGMVWVLFAADLLHRLM